MPVNHMLHANINVTNLERSIAFYERLGFSQIMEFGFNAEQAAATCAAFDLRPTAFRGVLMRLGDDPAASCIDLVEWGERPEAVAPASVANATGLYRVALTTADVDGLLAELQAASVSLLGPVCRTTTPTGDPCAIFAFRDPDGVVIEIVG